MSRCTTNKEAWQLLFNKYNILEQINQNGFFKITAKQINEYREARLMTKFDNSANLPELFKDNNLAILPITSNSYMIAGFQTYKKFEKVEDEEIINSAYTFIDIICNAKQLQKRFGIALMFNICIKDRWWKMKMYRK